MKELACHITKLPANHQLALSLRYEQELSNIEIAVCMAISLSMVEMHFRDIFMRLNEMIYQANPQI